MNFAAFHQLERKRCLYDVTERENGFHERVMILYVSSVF
jgi:hypothetical protein